MSTTNTSTAITAPAGSFHEEDAGRAVSGTGIPAGATIASVTSDTAATLSAAATATGTITATLGAAASGAYGFHGWSPETDAESETYTVAANNAGTATPDRLTNNVSAKTAQRARG
ncbi:MAG TPA: hypothetical protein VFV66_02915 [Nonomuraea sp.]|nr:hypothetical protein [Nonomuraea sp.]